MSSDGLDGFVRDTRPSLAKALGDRGVAVKIVDLFDGTEARLDGIPLALRAVPNEARVRAVAAGVKFLTEKCGLTESYLYDTATGGAELDLETKVQLLAVALCEPAPPHAPVVESADGLRALLEADEVVQIFESYADFVAERSPLSRAKSAEEVEAVLSALGKGTLPASRLTSFDSVTLRRALHSLAVRHERLMSSNSSDSSPSNEPPQTAA